MMNAVARPYAKVVGGVARSMSWDSATLIVGFVSGNRSNEREVFFPGPTPNISCGGHLVPASQVIVDTGTSTYAVGCDSGQLTFSRP